MTENEVLIKTPEEAIETIKSNMPTSGYQMLRESLEMAITALKEVQQYREIGTVEQVKNQKENLNVAYQIISDYEQYGTIEDFKKAQRYMRLVKAHGTIGQVIDSCAEYEEIGTVEECREAVEKQKAERIEYETDAVFSNGFSHYRIGKCPICDNRYNSNDEIDYCSKCGQKLDWSEEDERD